MSIEEASGQQLVLLNFIANVSQNLPEQTPIISVKGLMRKSPSRAFSPFVATIEPLQDRSR